MIRKVFWFLFLLVCFACNKQKRWERRLEGSWLPTLVWYQNADGFTFYDSLPSGQITIDKGLAWGQVVSDFSAFQGNVSDTLGLDGPVYLRIPESEVLWTANNDSTVSRLFALTNQDLDFERYDAQSKNRFRYIFKKF